MLTYIILVVFAIIMTWLSLIRYQFVLSVVAMLAWFALWGYHLTNPPTNITIGTFVYDLLYYGYIIMALGVFLKYIAGRTGRQTKTSYKIEDGSIVSESTTVESKPVNRKEEYRTKVRRALRPNRRGG